jgi:hypothetical protein
MNTNDFLPFCSTDSGTNLIEQPAYVVSAARPIGNQPGIASSQLNNKALRQGTYVVSQLAQYISNQANVSTFDDAIPAELLAQMNAAFLPIAPILYPFLSGSTTWNADIFFFVASANATAGATYTNNSQTFTVVATISGGTILQTQSSGLPASGLASGGGLLTKTTGTGDSTITYYAFRAPTRLRIRMVGGGGGGQGSGTSLGTSATSGGNTTFGTSLLVANGGGVAAFNSGPPGPGGTASLGTGPIGIALQGSSGGAFQAMGTPVPTVNLAGGNGGCSPFGGAGAGVQGYADAIPNTGSGGGGADINSIANSATGGGGGSGGYIDAVIYNTSIAWALSYALTVGTGGAPGGAGPSGYPGGEGGSGLILLEEYFQ